MHFKVTIALAACLIVSRVAAVEDPPRDVEEAFSAAFQRYTAAKTIEDKLRILKGFLTEHPESPHTVQAVVRVVHHQAAEQDDLPGAIAYVETIRKAVSDARVALGLDLKLADMYCRGKRSADFEALALRLAASERLSFGQHLELIECAVELRSWDVVETSRSTALRLATPDAYRADHPDIVSSDAEVAAAARNRRGILLTYRGRRKAQFGQNDEALHDFERADGLLRKNALGLADHPLNLHWGKALMAQGRWKEAFDRLAPDALIMGDEEALAALETCYRRLGGEEGGFDSYAGVRHRELAKKLDDFTLPGFSGGEHRLQDLKGTLTLISFWHPT